MQLHLIELLRSCSTGAFMIGLVPDQSVMKDTNV